MNLNDESNPKGNTVTRREFFTRPMSWFARERESVRMPLCALKDVPEALLLTIVPVLRRGWTARICDTGIAYLSDDGREGVVWLSPEACAVTLWFDGVRTLAEVAAALDAACGLGPGRSVTLVCEAFLTLAEGEVYHPSGPLGPLPPPPPEGGHHA